MTKKDQSHFDPASLDKKMPQSAEAAIALLLQSWALFEVALTDWLISVVGMKHLDLGILLIGREDPRRKIDKLKALFTHLDSEENASTLKELGRLTERYAKIRNTVVHNVYLGHRPNASNPSEYELIYSPHRPTLGRRDGMDAIIIRIPDIKKTAKFAVNASKQIREYIRAGEVAV